MNFSRSALFHMKNRVCLRYFDRDCTFQTSDGFILKEVNKVEVSQEIINVDGSKPQCMEI